MFFWKNTWQYKRILEVLRDYWLLEQNEKKVEVTLKFLHENGEYQEKVIRWVNPKYANDKPLEAFDFKKLADSDYEDDFWK